MSSHLVHSVLSIINDSMPFMLWNSFLALIPLALAYAVFKKDAKKSLVVSGVALLLAIPRLPSVVRTVSAMILSMSVTSLIIIFCVSAVMVWLCVMSPYKRRAQFTCGAALFVIFLPNAPYVLTDVIHLIETIRVYPSETLLTVVAMPLYAAFMLLGFGAYVLSLIALRHYLHGRASRRASLVVELTLHALSALGIYLGRFLRFNSWDVATMPDTIVRESLGRMLNTNAVLTVLTTFVIIMVLYTVGRTVVDALTVYFQAHRVERLSAHGIVQQDRGMAA
jgi:uncharacterized membrane protein